MLKKMSLICILLYALFIYAEEFPIATGNFSQTYPQIAFDGDNYYVVYVDRRSGASFYGFYGRFVTPEGEVLAGETEIVPAHNAMSFMHHIARGDDQYLFVWSRQRGPYNYTRDTYARRLDGNGQPVGASFQVSLGNTLSCNFIRTAFDGENYLVIWQEGSPTQQSHIRAQFVSSTGSLIGQNFSIRPQNVPDNAAQIYPDILFDGTNYFVVWDDNRTGSRSIYGQFISPEGDYVGDNVIITTEPVDQMLVQVAFNGTHFLAVWGDNRENPNNKSVYGQLVDLQGNLVGNHIPISLVLGNIEKSWPSVGSNGNQFLVAWRQDVYRFSGREETLLFNNEEDREIIFSAAGFNRELERQLWYDVYGRVINADGSFGSEELPICTALYHQDEPAVASDMQDFLVAWMDSRNQNQYYDIYGMIIEGETADVFYPPQNLTAELININEIFLSWEEPLPSDLVITAYHIYENEELLYVIEDPSELSYQTTGRNEGDYTFYVTALYEDDLESEPSNQEELTVILLPPIEFSAFLDNGYVNCSWSDPSSLRALTFFRLYRNEVLLVETDETFFFDTEIEPGFYSYYVTAVYDDLYESAASDTIEVNVTGIDEPEPLSHLYLLKQNFPNPFNPRTTIQFVIPESKQVVLAVYDLKGRKIAILIDDVLPAGDHQIIWNGRDEAGRAMPSGVYFYRMRTDQKILTGKMMLLK